MADDNSSNPLNLQKLAKVCEMFSSDFPEERATAAALAHNMIRASGATWELIFRALAEAADRIKALEQQKMAAPAKPEWIDLWTEPTTDPERIDACLRYADAMTEWEQKFLVSISGRRRLSLRQSDVLRRLVDKARAEASVRGDM